MITREAVFWLLKKSLVSDPADQAGDSLSSLSAADLKANIPENDRLGRSRIITISILIHLPKLHLMVS